MPWEAKPPTPPPTRKTFGPIRQSPQQQRIAAAKLDRQRLQWAKRSYLAGKDRTKLAQTMTPERRTEVANGGAPPPPMSTRNAQLKWIDHALLKPGLSSADRKKLQFARSTLTHPGFNPLSWTGKQMLNEVDGMLGGAQKGISWIGRQVFSPEELATMKADFAGTMRDDTRYANAAANFITPHQWKEAQDPHSAMGVGLPGAVRRVLGSSVQSATQAAVGFGPGLVYQVTRPQEALRSYEQQIKGYYGPLLHGDTAPLQQQGLTPAALDALALFGMGEGAVGRVGALRATSAGLREGAITGAPGAYARAAILRQTPQRLIGTDATTMGRETPIRHVMREEPLTQGTTIEAGDRVEYTDASGQTQSTKATEKNGLVGVEAPDANTPVRHEIRGKEVVLNSAHRSAPFEQRMVPRSPAGQMISDIYWGAKERAATPTGRGKQLYGGKRMRTKKVREARETLEDRQRGALEAFKTEHRAIQKDVVLSTAYDRMFRYPNAVEGIDREIASRHQRGLDQTREQQEVITTLEKAREVVANPPPELQRAVDAGKVIAMDTEHFLIARGFLTPERAAVAKLAAQRWLEPGHLRDEPLSSAKRSDIEQELAAHFKNPTQTRIAMAYTDTLARAWGNRMGRNPADWYDEFIISAERVKPEDLPRLTEDALAQRRRPDRVRHNNAHSRLVNELEQAERTYDEAKASGDEEAIAAAKTAKDEAVNNELYARVWYGSDTSREGMRSNTGRKKFARELLARRKGRRGALPARIRTPKQLEEVMSLLDEMTTKGEEGRFWYERSAEGIKRIAGGDKELALELAQLVAIYSPQQPIIGNLSLAVRAMNQYRFTGEVAVGQVWQKAAAQRVLSGAGDWTGRKTNNFYVNFLEDIDPKRFKAEGFKGDEVTGDMWMARVFGYKTDALSHGRYDIIEETVRHLAKERGWKPKQVQAAIWTAIKDASDDVSANIDFSDAIDRYQGQVNFEVKPGETADPAFQAEFDSWTPEVQAAYMDASSMLYDDFLTEAGILRVPGETGPGIWEGDVSPGGVARPLTSAISKEGPDVVAPAERALYEFAAAAAGTAFLQDAVGWLRTIPDRPRIRSGTMVVETKVPITDAEAAAFERALNADEEGRFIVSHQGRKALAVFQNPEMETQLATYARGKGAYEESFQGRVQGTAEDTLGEHTVGYHAHDGGLVEQEAYARSLEGATSVAGGPGQDLRLQRAVDLLTDQASALRERFRVDPSGAAADSAAQRIRRANAERRTARQLGRLPQRREGDILGLARITEQGTDIYLTPGADVATWVEEAGHAVIPTWFEQADSIGDLRGDVLRNYVGLEPGAAITGPANESIVRLLQTWLHDGATPSPQLRSLFEGLSSQLKEGYREGVKSIAKDAEEVKLFQRMLDDPKVTSFLRDQFDVSPVKDFDPGTVAFQTMKSMGRFTRQGGADATTRLQRGVRSVLPSRKNLAKQANTMRAWESGNYDVGPEVTAHYANAELRTRMQDEQARRVLRYQEPIEIVNGRPMLKPGYQVYNYYGVRRANARIDEMFRRSQRYGDILDSENEMLSADPGTGSIVDMEPDDFTDLAGMEVGRILTEEMISPTIEQAAAKTDNLLQAIRDGKVGQVPNDVIESFLGGSGGTFATQAAENALRGIAMVVRIPTMLARWRMITKVAYPALNAAQSALLVGMHQGPFLALSIRRTLELSRMTRVRLMQEVGIGVAELTDVPDILGKTRLERAEAAEQVVFRKWMHLLSQPEARVRLTQMVNDLGRAGYRTEEQIVSLLDRVKDGDPEATALLNQVGRWAEDATVRFRGLSPGEQFIVRDALFVYGWLRSAARFTLQFPLNRPVTAAVSYHIGQFGWQQLQHDFYALAWEQQGAIPLGQRKSANGFLRKVVDLSQFFPFKSAFDLMRPVFQMMGLEDTGLRPASFADLFSPSAEFAARAVYGQDPRYGTGIWEGLMYDLNPKNLPGVYWMTRLMDPTMTGTKLRGPADRWGVLVNLLMGQAAPYDVQESASYDRWLNQQPTDMRTLIREQNNATQLAGLVDYAAKVSGGAITQEEIRAINADSAEKIYSGLWETKLGREKGDSGYNLTAVQRAAVKARTLQHYYPAAYEQATNETRGLDLKNPQDVQTFADTWDEAWSTTVADTLTDARASVKDVLGVTPPERSHIPFKQWRRDFQWLQTASPDSLSRIRQRVSAEGISLSDEAALAPVIEQEMLRVSTP